MDEVVTDSSARTTIWNSSKSKSQEVRGSDNSQLDVRDQENLQEEDDDVPIQEGEFRAKKKNKILNYHSLRVSLSSDVDLVCGVVLIVFFFS